PACRSDHVRERAFIFAELSNAEPQHHNDNAGAHGDALPIELALRAQYAPAESIDNSNQRIQVENRSPASWHDIDAKSNWRDIQCELQRERNYIAEIAIFRRHRREIRSCAEGSQSCHDREDWQEQKLPAGNVLVPNHQA